MDGQRHARHATFRRALRAGVAACALAAVVSGSTFAQTQPAKGPGGLPAGAVSVPPGSKLLLSSQQLDYNDRTHVVVASGAVRIDYGGYKLVADRVEYNQDTHRMKATGHVELVSPDGTKTYAETMDVTDDFADGFVNALRIDTTDRTHIVATSAERRGGVETQFNNGVYTACEPCKKNPEKAPFWQVKARKVVHDSSTKTIRLYNARMEMFGVPVGYFPYFSVPDQTVKRKSGFLRPSIGYSNSLGAQIRVPYYQVFSPYSDATFTGTALSKQGFLGEAEFRQRFRNGTHVLTLAGIDQLDPGSFNPGTVDADHNARGLIASRGLFEINPRWSVGWDLMAESDDNFGRTYGIAGYANSTHTSQAHLTGLAGRNYFDLHAYYFDIQSNDEERGVGFKNLERQQPFVLPVIDYQHVSELGGGQLTFTANETTLTRSRTQFLDVDPLGRRLPLTRFQGLEGDDSRLTGELEWKRTFTTPGGLLLTPIAAARGDAFFVDMDDPAGYTGDFAGNGTHARGMVTGGLEARYPILASAAHSTHVIEPIAQIFVRPDEPLAGGLPNEDAQSFVFDTSNLFERDKFSGFDRVEGGTRANVGVRYTGSFDNGVTLASIFGQSYQIAGQNSFATPDLVYAGHDSGLDTDVSDYVGSVGFALPIGLSANAGGRFDKDTFDIKRTDLTGAYSSQRFSTGITYSQIAPQPEYGSLETQREVSTNAVLNFSQSWHVYGNVTYNFDQSEITRDGIGLMFDNECFAFNVAFSQDKNARDNSPDDWKVGATLSFRTLGDVTLGSRENARPATYTVPQ